MQRYDPVLAFSLTIHKETIMYSAKRQDGSFETLVNDLPYHVTRDDPLFSDLSAQYPNLQAGTADVDGVMMEDHRNETGYVNGEPFMIADFGPYPDGWSTEAPPEDQYNTERTAVALKYTAPWNGETGGILTCMQTLMVSALCKIPQDAGEIAAIARRYAAGQQSMYAELDSIDQKYGVA